MAKEYGADLIGFVFAPSRRRVTVPTVQKIISDVPGIGKVGVFVNAPLPEVKEIVKRCKLDFVQLHGNESPEYCKLLKYPVIKAVGVGADFDPRPLAAYEVEWLLLDSLVPGQQGGTGVTFDWQRTKVVRQQLQRPVFIAGGLTAENVRDAVAILGPEGIDVSGGVETNGYKDDNKIAQFLRAARGGKGGATYDIRENCP